MMTTQSHKHFFNPGLVSFGRPLWLTLFFVVAVLPVMLVLGQSLVKNGVLSFDHYGALLTDSRLVMLFTRSLFMAFAATMISVLLGVPFAFFLARYDFFGKKIFSSLYLLPLFIPPHVHALAWMHLSGKTALVNTALMSALQTNTPVFTMYNVPGVICILAFSYMPLVVLLTLTGLAGMDTRHEEAAALHSKPFAVLRTITLPLLYPSIVTGAVFVFILSFFNYGVPSMLRVPSYSGEILTRFSAFYDTAGAAALSVPLILLAGLLLSLLAVIRTHSRHATIYSRSRRASLKKLSGIRRLFPLYMFIILLLTVVLPGAALLVQAGSAASYTMALVSAQSEIRTTLSIAAGAATCTTLFACLLIYCTKSLTKSKQLFFEGLTFLPFAFPASILGVGLISLWNRSATQFIYGSFAILILACVARFIPFAVYIIKARFSQISSSLFEAALFCSTGRLVRWRTVEFPLMRQGIFICWIITFIFCTGELGATLLVIPPGLGTLSLKIYSLMHYGAGPLVAALALLLVGINLFASLGLLLRDPLHTASR